MTRLAPVPEAVSLSSFEDARRAWDPTDTSARVERSIKIRGCLDLATVLNTVPDYYRGVLSSLGSSIMDMLEELDKVTRRKSKYESLKARGEIPFHYNSMRLPSIQYGKGAQHLYKEHFGLPAKDQLKEDQKRMFEKELKFLAEYVNELQSKTDTRALVMDAWSALQRRYEARPQGDFWEVSCDLDPNAWPTEMTAEKLEISRTNFLQNELRALQVDLPVYLQKFKDLKLDAVERVHGKGKKTAEEKRDIDMEVQDVASLAAPETQSAINKEAQRQAAAAFAPYKRMLDAFEASGSSPSKKVRRESGSHQDPTHVSCTRTYDDIMSLGPNQKGEEEGEEGESHTQRQGETPGEETTSPSWRRQRAQQQWAERERERESKEIVGSILGKPWTFGVPQSYPDEILLLTPSEQADVLLSRAPLSLVDANRFRSSVHVQPGLFVPNAIQHDLSASLKFMFETKIDKTLIQKAYTDLVRRIRWKWHFIDQVGDEYDPDYDVTRTLPLHKEEKKRAPVAAPHIERGLAAGQDYVTQVLTSIPEPDDAARFTPLRVKRAQEFMVSNNLIVTSTDKNLGVAVFKRDWIYQQSVALFGDSDNYTPLTKSEATTYLSEMAKYIRELCEIHLPDQKQLSTFMSHNLPAAEEGDEWTNWCKFIPEAYAIPKIHKNPWKGRPICPGYMLPQNPASKFCAKTLRPFIETRPWIIQGSKDFVRKLADVKIPVNRRTFIVSADVVNFYPSVDLELLQNALKAFAEHTIIPKEVENGIISHTKVDQRSDFYQRMFKLALSGPVMTFLEQILYQHKGLPMGAAGSPEMANMFGLWYEMEWMDKITENDDILFFGRYLDDIYSVVVAETPDEAATLIASIVSYGDVKLLWEPPSDQANFLDLTTRIKGDRIYHEPFVKAMSHRERIPWSSAHPKDVKKGTFSSEISRLATLCSDYSVFASQCEEAVNLYIGRGYPKNLVTRWLKDQKEERWEKRLSVKTEEDPARTYFTLKTHFNEAWKSFNVQELESRITAQWQGVDTSVVEPRRPKLRGRIEKRPRQSANIRLQGQQFPGQSRLMAVQEDGTDVTSRMGPGGVRSASLALNEKRKELKWTQQWITTGKFLVSRRKNTQLWDITRGWNRTVWNRYMIESGMLKPFDPLYEGLVVPNENSE